MKTNLLALLTLVATYTVQAQNIGIGTAAPHASAALDVHSTTAGLLPPRLSTAQRNSIAAPATGLVVFNINTASLEIYNGTSWLPLSGGSRWGNRDVLSYQNSEAEVYLNYHSSTSDYGDYLGNSMDRWGNYIAVGAYNDHSPDGNLLRTGSVRILLKENGRWQSWNWVIPPDLTAGMYFGADVAFDGPNLIVGASKAKAGTIGSKGKAYVYTIDPNGNFIFQDTLVSTEGKALDYFGHSVSVSNNYAIVGAPQYDVPGKTDRGAAFVFSRVAGQWSQVALLAPPDGEMEDLFGNVVAISGRTAAVTALHAAPNNQTRGGKVYLFERINNVWTYDTTLTSGPNGSYDKFGSDLYLKGDTLIIGSSQYNGDQANKSGKVYLYVRNGGTWVLQATLSSSDGRTGDGFGDQFHYADGQLVVGAPYADVYGNQSQGKAYVFRLQNGNWIEEAVLAAYGGKPEDRFGLSVIGDGNTVLVAAPYATNRGAATYGRLYWFQR